MKVYLFMIFVSLSNLFFGQIYFNFTKNLDLYKPYSALTQEYMQVNNKIYSNTQSFSLRFNAKQKKQFSWDLGFVYKRINQIVDDKVLGYYAHFVSPSGNQDYYYKVDEKLDLESISHSIGVLNQFDYLLFEKNKFINKIGVINEIYLFENFTSIYRMESGENFNDEFYDLNLSPLNSNFGSRLFLSSLNLSCHYLFEFHANENFSLATKISLGTNLYSDWDQFKKYAWLGVGLELGFGNKPFFKKKSGNFD